jgi:hypothetical protein
VFYIAVPVDVALVLCFEWMCGNDTPCSQHAEFRCTMQWIVAVLMSATVAYITVREEETRMAKREASKHSSILVGGWWCCSPQHHETLCGQPTSTPVQESPKPNSFGSSTSGQLDSALETRSKASSISAESEIFQTHARGVHGRCKYHPMS